MSVAYEVRPATRRDVPTILRIYNDAVRNTTASFDYEPQSLALRMHWFDDHQRTGHPIFVACNVRNRVIGWSALSKFRDRPGYRFTAEDSIFIEPAYRGKGIGRALILPLIERAYTMHLHTILAAIDASNTPSLRLHLAYGFEQVACLKQIGYKFERWLDVVYLQLMLCHEKQTGLTHNE
jgi:phosphinothricin acetyltransferase